MTMETLWNLRVTLAKTHSKEGYRAQKGHLLQPEKTSDGGLGYQPSHKTLDPQFFPANKMCRGKDGAEIERIANQ